jgi:hypothetical protein
MKHIFFATPMFISVGLELCWGITTDLAQASELLEFPGTRWNVRNSGIPSSWMIIPNIP